MSRSLKKGPYVDERLMAKVERNQRHGQSRADQDLVARLHHRAGFRRHDVPGSQRQEFLRLYVTEDMVGHKLGEFAPTRIFKGHSGGKGKASDTHPGVEQW